MMTAQGKTIVITGGTAGIGYQLTKLLSPQNTVVVVACNSAHLKTLQQEFPTIYIFVADLSQPSQYQQLAHAILADHPAIDVLINNAAVQHTATFLDPDFAYPSIFHEINLNFSAVCALSYLLLPALLRTQQPAVIANINSGLGLVPKTTSAIYCATKGAMNIFSQSLGYQLKATNVQVMQAFLPLVDTTMTAGRGAGKISAAYAAKQIIAGIEKGSSVQNIGKVKWMRLLLAVAPWLIKSIMQRS